MSSPNDWKENQARWDAALALGESVAKELNLQAAPINPFSVIEAEGGRIKAFGADFGKAFDGRLEYQPKSFLLYYNTKYNSWQHAGAHHPKVRFTVGHELGHYHIVSHRKHLVRRRAAHCSVTDFVSDRVSEREADAFSAGLLMPGQVLGRVVNKRPPTLPAVRAAVTDYQVSLTSMLVRWVQLSHFPCAVAAVKAKRIQWGFVSDAFKKVGGYRVRWNGSVTSPRALEFLNEDPTLTRFREGQAWSVAGRWIEFAEWEDGRSRNMQNYEVQEDYVVIPSTQQMLAFITAAEIEDERSDE